MDKEAIIKKIIKEATGIDSIRNVLISCINIPEYIISKNHFVLESSDLDTDIHQAASSPSNDLPEPTDKQKISGNYKKGHIIIAGMDIAIENPEGSERSGTDRNGNKWAIILKHHYGYIKGTEGKDKDQIDVFINPDLDKEEIEKLPVFIVDQINRDGSFDEHKVLMGFPTRSKAEQAYFANYEEGWNGFGDITKFDFTEFKSWVFEKSNTKKPVSMILEDARGDHSFGVLMVSLPEVESEVLKNFALSLPPEDIELHPRSGEPWIESESHVTLKYGLQPTTPEAVKRVLAGTRPIRAMFGNLDIFENKEADVLFVKIISPDLLRLNDIASKELPCIQNGYEYSPHATIAFLKKGAGAKYKGMNFFSGLSFRFNAIDYSTAGGDLHIIDL